MRDFGCEGRAWRLGNLGQRENDQRFVIVIVAAAHIHAAAFGDRYILFPVLAEKCHRDGHCVVVQLDGPQLLAGRESNARKR